MPVCACACVRVCMYVDGCVCACVRIYGEREKWYLIYGICMVYGIVFRDIQVKSKGIS